jgi:DNA-binding SARP family transcriptional activator
LIEERRRAAGLTQRALAERSGVSVGAIRDLEQGRTSWPRPGAAQRLAEALGVDEQYLARLAGPPPGAHQERHGHGPAQDVRLALLGPLAARRDGVPVDLGGERQRAVLALLAISAGQAVHRAGIIDAIWGEAPPPSAISMIQSYVSRLRDALGPGAGARAPGRRDDLLVSVGESYLLRLGAEQLDALEFAGLAARARQRAAAGDAAASCELFARALGLWRGEAAADVGLLRGHPAVAALARQRTAAVLEYAEVAAGAGWHERALEQLRALAEREPLDERALARLMTALGATGQQAAALRVFEDARARLDRELGVIPGPELGAAHLRILRGETQPAAGRENPPQQAGPATAAASPAPRPASPAPPAAATATAGRPAAATATAGRPAAATATAARPAAASGRPANGNPRDRGPARGGPPALVLPRQLPSAVRHFAGREPELKALWEALDQAGPRPGAVVISAIGGMAGVGKTALAVHWAQQVADRFPDGQLFADLRGFGPDGDPADPAQVIGWFLASLGVPATQVPADPHAQAALLRSVLTGKRVLIVLDNAADAGQVRPLLPGSPGCLVLVTSRARLTGLAAADGATVLDLDLLDSREATELLARRLGRDRLAAEPATAGDLVELCGRLPLALAIAAAHAAARPAFPLAQLAAGLRGEAGRLDALDTGESASSVRQVFSWSYRQLTGPAAAMFRLLGIHPGPDISAPAATSLAGVPPATARRALAELTGAHLLTEHSPGRYALHDLLRAYAAELAAATDPESGRRAALGRVLDHYLHTAHAAALVLSPLRPPIALAGGQAGAPPERLDGQEQVMAWFEAEDHVLASAIAKAADHGFDAHAWQLVWTTSDFYDWRGRWQEWAALQQSAVAAATRLGDAAAQAVTHRGLAGICAKLGEYDQARVHLSACIGFYQQVGNSAGEARAHQTLSWVAEHQDRYADALSHAQQALSLFTDTDDRAGQASAINAVGWGYILVGEYERGREFCRQALERHREIGTRHSEAHTWDSLGYAERNLGHLAEAAACFERGIRLFRAAGDQYYEAQTLAHLGDTRQAAGDLPQARAAWRQACDIFEEIHSPDADEVRAKLSEMAVR